MTPPTLTRAQGRLALAFDWDERRSRTRLARRECVAPLQVVRPFEQPDGGLLIHMQSVAGGVLGGDKLEIDVSLASGARVQLTTTGANRIYRPRETDAPAVQATRLALGAGALLEYLPDPTIPFAGARYRQETRITLGDGAGLYWWEVLFPGRAAHGERFAYDRLDLAASIDTEGGLPIARDRAVLEPGRRALDLPGRLGPYQYLATFYALRVGMSSAELLAAERALTDVALELSEPGECVWGVSALAAHGLVARGLSKRSHRINASLIALWREAKRLLHGEEISIPRKVW